LAGFALVEIILNVTLGKTDAGRAAVNDTSQGWTVALAPGGNAEKVTESIVRHVFRPRQSRPFVKGALLMKAKLS